MTHSISRLFPVLVMTTALLGGGLLGRAEAAPAPTPPVGAAPAAPTPCTTTAFKFKDVKAACERGGQPAAKDLMKELVKKAKAADKTVKCTDCHVNITAFVLKPNAVADLKALGVK